MQSNPEMLRNKLVIRTLGAFSVEMNGENLAEDTSRQKQIWTLFKYILTYRNRRIPPEEFYDVLWRTDSCDNPAKALQNLVYRLRRELSSVQANGSKYILLRQGCYCWNNDLPLELDVDMFERLNIKAMDEELAGNAEQALSIYRECLSLYTGNYLTECSSQEWVIPSANYYKRLFINITTRVTQLLQTMERHEEILEVCENAFHFEPYEEQLHTTFIQALLALGRPKQARTHYEYITSALYREFGVKPSPMLKDIYRFIFDTVPNANTDLDVLQNLLSEKETAPEAFQCEPDLFRSIYKLEARRAARTGQMVYLALLTVMPATQSASDSDTLMHAMDHLGRLLPASLRRGDVVSRWNNSQYVIMLSCLTYEDSGMILSRLQDKFESSFSHKGIIVRHKLQPLNAT